jgi:hypothetical protein
MESRSDGFMYKPTPYLLPGIRDQLEHIALFRTLAGRLDDDLEWAAIRQHAQVVAVPVGQPDIVQQPIGLVDVECGPCVKIGFVEQWALRQHGVAAFRGESQVDRLIDLAAIDGERQRATEAHVADELAPFGIGGIEIGVERNLRSPRRVPQQYLVLATRLALLQQREVVEAQIAGGEVASPAATLAGISLLSATCTATLSR